MNTLLMSIRPPYSSRILAGTKRFELRRSNVHADPGDVVIVYASAPTMAVVGAFTVKGVLRDRPDRLWRRHGRAFGIEKSLYNAYFDGRELGNAIEVDEVVTLGPISLDVLRRRVRGFRPPQSYMRWRRDLEDLLGDEAGRIEGELALAK